MQSIKSEATRFWFIRVFFSQCCNSYVVHLPSATGNICFNVLSSVQDSSALQAVIHILFYLLCTATFYFYLSHFINAKQHGTTKEKKTRQRKSICSWVDAVNEALLHLAGKHEVKMVVMKKQRKCAWCEGSIIIVGCSNLLLMTAWWCRASTVTAATAATDIVLPL